jgi:hypothetical protein
MVALLEANRARAAVVNFTPVLIEQLQELAECTSAHLRDGRQLPDAVLAVLSSRQLPQGPEPRLALLRALLRADRQHLVNRYPAFTALVELSTAFLSLERVHYASDAYFATSASGITSRGSARPSSAPICAPNC